MKTHDASWEDLVFENRNKAYGAYAIRQSYSSHVTEAIFGSLLLVALVLLYPRIASLWGGEKIVFVAADQGTPIITLTPNPLVVPNTKAQVKVKVKTETKVKSVAHIKLVQLAVPDVDFVEEPERTSVPETGTGNVEVTGQVNTTGIGSTVTTKSPGTIAQFMPAYEGGMQAMSRFITNHLKYPRHADKEGKVYVEFVVDEEGKVVDVKVVRGISQEYDKEAARVVALMPNWKPGRNGDQTVPVRMVLPINFILGQ